MKQRRARPAANLCAQLGLEASQQGLGRIGGKLAGHIGENRFVVGAADDGRSKCQSILCREYLRPGEPRIGKRPPSVRWGHSPKTKWYHIDCCFASFKRTCKKSKTITSVDDIEGFASLDAATAKRGAGKGRDIPDSKAPISTVFHSFRLIFGRAIISRSALEACMLFPERARAERSR